MMYLGERNDIESVYKRVGQAIDEAGADQAALYLAKVVLVLSEAVAPGVLEDALRGAAAGTRQAGDPPHAA